MDALHRVYFGNSITSYLLAAGIVLLGFLVVRVLLHYLLKALDRWAARTHSSADDFILASLRKAINPLAYYAIFYFALRSLHLNPAVEKAVTAIGTLIVTFVAVRLVLQAFRYFVFDVYLKKHTDTQTLERQAKAFTPVVTVIVWTLGVIFLLDNLGFKISTLVAGLGIGGVALALASQTVLGDVFSYFAIMMDQPFELDDFIVVNDFMGSVEHIGLKTTRIRSLGGEQLVLSNKDLTDSRIRNYKRMDLRRIEFNVGVSYGTPVDKLRKAGSLIKDIITTIPKTRFDRAHFWALQEFQLTLQIVYFVLSADYNLYMDVQQEINVKIMEAFKNEGIEFAQPVRPFVAKSN